MTVEQKRDEILAKHGLDFTIIKTPLFANVGETTIPTDYYGLVNSKIGKVIHSCKEGYVVSQNSEVVELVLRGIEKFGSQLNVTKAGAINEGRKVYLQLEIEGVSKLKDNDIIKKYITVIDSNDGSTGLSIGIGDLTMSCQNQFFKFHKRGQSKFMHSVSMQERIKEIPFLIGLALEESMHQITMYNKLANVSVTKKLASELVNGLIGYDKMTTPTSELDKMSTRAINIMDTMYTHIEKEMAQKGMNAWGLHSGITSYTTHEISIPKRENGRIESLLVGSAYKMNQKSLEFVSELV